MQAVAITELQRYQGMASVLDLDSVSSAAIGSREPAMEVLMCSSPVCPWSYHIIRFPRVFPDDSVQIVNYVLDAVLQDVGAKQGAGSRRNLVARRRFATRIEFDVLRMLA